MGERIELPPTLSGDERAQLQQVWSYLYQTAEKLNINLEGIGGNDLTDSEKLVMEKLIKTTAEQAGAPGDMAEAITLKSLIIKTADTVASSLQEIRKNLVAETVAEGRFGRYVRNTSQEVEVTPDHDKRTFTFSELIQGLKTYEVNAKNYIKSGLLRTEGLLPVYGVAIGKDVVTFSVDGTETYNDSNKVAELTADELSFWQNGVKIASYTGGKISFLYNGNESFYIENGKIYCSQDLELTGGKKIVLNNWTLTDGGLEYRKDGEEQFFEIARKNDASSDTTGMFYRTGTGSGAGSTFEYGELIFRVMAKLNSTRYASHFRMQERYTEYTDPMTGVQSNTMAKFFLPGDTGESYPANIGEETNQFTRAWIREVRAGKLHCDDYYSDPNNEGFYFNLNDVQGYLLIYPHQDDHGNYFEAIRGYKRLMLDAPAIYAEYTGTENDLNSMIVPGFYRMKSATWNLPPSLAGPLDIILEVVGMDNHLMQRFFHNGILYIRRTVNPTSTNAFGNWYKFAGVADT